MSDLFRIFHSHKIRLLALLGLLTGEKTDFPTVSYTSTIQLGKSLLFHTPEALGTLFGQQSLPVYAITVSTPELKNKMISTLQHHS